MAQVFLTLDEAAQKLAMSQDELKALARKREIHSFQDRGTMRFRLQDIEELARRRGQNSEPDLVLGETLKPMPVHDAGPKSPTPKPKEAEVFDFSIDTDEVVGIGNEPLGFTDEPSSKKKKVDSKLGPRTPHPTPDSDSDVKLVGASSDVDFPAVNDLPTSSGPESPPPRKRTSGLKDATVQSQRPSQLGKKSSKLDGKRRTGLPADQPPVVDSGVRLVPIDGDSDVRIEDDTAPTEVPLGGQPSRASTDSDVRLEHAFGATISDEESHITEEIDLGDIGLELHRRKEGKKDSEVHVPEFPATSPFELSEPDINLPAASEPNALDSTTSDSSDFELTPASEKSSPLEGDSGSSDFTLELPDDSDEIGLADPSISGLKTQTGLDLPEPVDSGISLENRGTGSSDEIEFELTLDEGPSSKSGSGKKAAPDSDSEFELTLDADADAGTSSDSEFELTLDDSGGLTPLDDSGSGEKDIFETNFDVPALDDSGSEALALDDADTDLASSDFELALGGDDVAADESGSEVLALDEDALDEEPAVGRRRRGAVDDEDFAEDLAPEDLAPPEPVVREKLVGSAPWGVLPVAMMLPCVIVLFLVGFMGFELIQSQGGYKPAGPLTRAVGDLLGQKMKN